jgi:hypothetical protein
MKHRIIDIHSHPSWYGFTVDRLVANMDEHGIARTWLLSGETTEAEFNVVPHYYEVTDPRGISQPLWMVVEGLQRFPDRFIGGWAPDPRDRYARPRLKAAVSHHGIKVCGELKFRMRYDSPDAIALYRYCAELGLPVLFHLEAPEYRLRQQCKGPHEWPEWYGGDIAAVANMCHLCPDTVFIGHGPGFWREMSAGARRNSEVYPAGPVRPGGRLIRIMRKYRNLHADLSGASGRNALTRDPGHAKTFLAEFQDRLMFGRDGFDGSLLEALQKLNPGGDIMAKLLHGNAEKILPSEAAMAARKTKKNK